LPWQISLGGGLPNPNLFPVRGATFELDDGTTIALEPELVKEALQYSATVRIAGLTRCRDPPPTNAPRNVYALVSTAGPAGIGQLAHGPAAPDPRPLA